MSEKEKFFQKYHEQPLFVKAVFFYVFIASIIVIIGLCVEQTLYQTIVASCGAIIVAWIAYNGATANVVYQKEKDNKEEINRIEKFSFIYLNNLDTINNELVELKRCFELCDRDDLNDEKDESKLELLNNQIPVLLNLAEEIKEIDLKLNFNAIKEIVKRYRQFSYFLTNIDPQLSTINNSIKKIEDEINNNLMTIKELEKLEPFNRIRAEQNIDMQ